MPSSRCASCSTMPPKRLRHPGLQRQQPRTGAGGDEAAAETDAPVILQASAGARKYAGEAFIKHLIQAAVDFIRTHAAGDAPGPRPEPGVCQGAIELGFSSVMMDGSPGVRRQDHRRATTTTSTSRAKVVDMAHALGVTVEAKLGCLGSLETMKGDKEDGHGTDATMTASSC